MPKWPRPHLFFMREEYALKLLLIKYITHTTKKSTVVPRVQSPKNKKACCDSTQSIYAIFSTKTIISHTTALVYSWLQGGSTEKEQRLAMGSCVHAAEAQRLGTWLVWTSFLIVFVPSCVLTFYMRSAKQPGTFHTDWQTLAILYDPIK